VAKSIGYAQTMAISATTVLIFGAIVILLGPEAHRIKFGRSADSPS